MKVYISADMEGVAGITSEEQTNPAGHPEYSYSCELMTGEVRAACEGAAAAGATHILVNDSHWNMRNVIHEHLPPQVELIRGDVKPLSMNEGLDPSFGAVVFVGYHAAIGTQNAILDHTYTDATLFDVIINGERCSEARINAAVAGAFGVPVVFVSGDQSACEDARSFMPWVTAVQVKTAIGRTAARSLSPAEARKRIREGVQRALSGALAKAAQPYGFAPPIVLELTFVKTSKADMAALVPRSERMGARTLRFSDADFLTVFRAFRAMTALGGLA